MGTLRAGLLGAAASVWLAGLAGAQPAATDDRGLGCRQEVAPISAGFGAPGVHPVLTEEIDHPGWPGHAVTLSRPGGVAGPVPVVFFAHGFGASDPIHYRALLSHLVGRGLAVVYAPYAAVASRHGERYEMLWAGFQAAARHGGPHLDLTRVGFLGHSFGGGATPHLAHRGLVERGWGTAGAFVMVMAPWYVLGVDERAVAELPAHVRVVVQVYEDERVNDHRIAIELFEAFDAERPRSFLLLRSDRHGACHLRATHTTPATDSVRGRLDGLDRYGVFRVIDALAADAFGGDPDAHALLFPPGPASLGMGRWPDGTPVTPAHIGPAAPPSRPPSSYAFPLASRERWLLATEVEF